MGGAGPESARPAEAIEGPRELQLPGRRSVSNAPFGCSRYTPPVNLDVETTTKDGANVVSLRGEIDVYTAPRLRQTLIDLVEGGATDIVVDMERVDFLDSTGLGVLVGGLKRVKDRDGTMKLVANQDRILKIFDITGLSKVFPIFGSLDEALKS